MKWPEASAQAQLKIAHATLLLVHSAGSHLTLQLGTPHVEHMVMCSVCSKVVASNAGGGR